MTKAKGWRLLPTATTSLTALCLLASSLVGIIALSSLYLQDERQQNAYGEMAGLSEKNAAQLAKPAVIEIYNFATVSLSVQPAGINVKALQSTINQLANQSRLDLHDGRAVLDALTALMSQDPARYLIPLPDTLNLSASINATGSGFIVTPDGYVVSNAHVVVFPDYIIEQTIKSDRALFLATFYPQLYAEANGVVKNIFIPLFPEIASLQLTPEEQKGLMLPFIQYYENAPFHITGFVPNVFAGMRVSIAGVFVGGKLVPAEVIPSATGKADGKDVAILKIDGNNNLPTVDLGSESSLGPLDDIIAIGFPASVSNFPELSAQGIQPSITKGQFSGFQPTIYGFNLIQTSTPISHGSSGGPAIDSFGRVVGITTSTGINPVTGQEENSAFNFFIPVSIVKDYLNRINIHAEQSQFTKMYRQALIEYEARNYSQSLKILDQLNNIAPGSLEVQNLTAVVQTLTLQHQSSKHSA